MNWREPLGVGQVRNALTGEVVGVCLNERCDDGLIVSRIVYLDDIEETQ